MVAKIVAVLFGCAVGQRTIVGSAGEDVELGCVADQEDATGFYEFLLIWKKLLLRRRARKSINRWLILLLLLLSPANGLYLGIENVLSNTNTNSNPNLRTCKSFVRSLAAEPSTSTSEPL